ncbi:hypothetical protein [Acinetobacter beijerinckii]|uniref:hypothetical protein n=1 Tax=Acinetobacter beijerinckii TaxID=262668 RepID=UPI0030168DB1
MKERPILFSTPMVQALIEARKTQTRRVVKSELIIDQAEFESGNRPHVIRSEPSLQYWVENGCPFGNVGDRLWVRETWQIIGDPASLPCQRHNLIYKADYPNCVDKRYDTIPDITELKFKPSIHMPRWASRILLEITNIRIEHLNDISEEDAAAEGMIADDDFCAEEYFSMLWNEINGWGEKGWNANPWVWVIEFKVIHGEKHE